MDYVKFFESKAFRGFLAGIATFIVFLVAFRAGMSVGFQKADFSHRFGDNYQRNFIGAEQAFRGGLDGREFADAHGLIGQVIRTDGRILAVRSKDGLEKIVFVASGTPIARFRGNIGFEGVKAQDLIIVLGDPNEDGRIDAKFIRILPPPDSGMFMPPGPQPAPPIQN